MLPWPPSLQQLMNVDSFDYKQGPTVARTDMDIGPAKVRRRFTKSIDTITTSIYISSVSEYNTLFNFYQLDTLGGSQPFTWVHPITQAAITLRFTDAPDYKPLGGLTFEVSLSLEVLP